MHNIIRLLPLSIIANLPILAADYQIHTWEKHRLSTHFWAEGATIADFDKDGNGDVAVGPYIYSGPDFQKKSTIYPDTASFELKKGALKKEKIPGFKGELSGTNGYSDNFLTHSYDMNGDGWVDILVFGWPGKDTTWYENPGKGAEGHWKAHVIFSASDGESPRPIDMDGDGKPELLLHSGGFLGYVYADWNQPAKPWKFKKISKKGKWSRYSHGYGAGDVNNDGRMDILESLGWREQPEKDDGQLWKYHKYPFSTGRGGAQMYAYDFDGDGDNDVLTSLDAHGYGVAWYESKGVKEDGSVDFEKHLLVFKEPSDSPYGIKFTQPHSITMADVDNDGIQDFLTGKRFWAHGPGKDAEPGAPPVLYWFKTTRTDKGVDFVPHLIDNASGTGTQHDVKDINGDGLVDVAVGNKKGAFVFIQKTEKVDKATWEKAQPKPLQ